MKIKSDENLNVQLQEDAQELRATIVNNCKVHSSRFIATSSTEKPEMVITDTQTNKTTTVPLFAYSDTMRVLGELFDEKGVKND